MSQDFKPFANETDVLRISDLNIENRLDQVTITGDVVLTVDQAGLALARQLPSLLESIVQALRRKSHYLKLLR